MGVLSDRRTVASIHRKAVYSFVGLPPSTTIIPQAFCSPLPPRTETRDKKYMPAVLACDRSTWEHTSCRPCPYGYAPRASKSPKGASWFFRWPVPPPFSSAGCGALPTPCRQ